MEYSIPSKNIWLLGYETFYIHNFTDHVIVIVHKKPKMTKTKTFLAFNLSFAVFIC